MREQIAATQIKEDCPTCKGEGYVLTAGTERYEICNECKHDKP